MSSASSSRPRFGLDGAATVFAYPPGVRRVAAQISAGLQTSARVEALPLVPAADENERAWRHQELPRLERELGLDGIVSFTSAFPVRGRGRRVQLIHELPWRHGETENADWKHRLWARHGWRRARAIVVPSERVLADLESESRRAAAKTTVISWGASAAFRPSAAPVPNADELATLTRLGVGVRPFFLIAGGTRAKKRAELAITAMISVAQTDAQLVITGALQARNARDLQLARNLGLEGRVHFVGTIPEAELALLTRRATAALSLAKSEGFGLGTLEALASGTRVVVLPASAPAEIAGPLALCAEDAESLGGTLQTLLAAPITPEQKSLAVERARAFTLDRAVTAFEDVLLDIAR